MPQCVGLSCRSPGGRAGCRLDLWSPPGPLPTWSHPPGCTSRAAARLYRFTAFVHLPYSPTRDPGDIGREKMPYGEYAAGRGEGSGPPHYSGIRFGIRFRVPIRSHPINIAESPEYGRPPPVGWSPNRVRSGRLPIRSHPINPIRSSPAGGVRELHGSGRRTLPFRGGNIDLRAGVDRSKRFCRILTKRFSRDCRHVSG